MILQTDEYEKATDAVGIKVKPAEQNVQGKFGRQFFNVLKLYWIVIPICLVGIAWILPEAKGMSIGCLMVAILIPRYLAEKKRAETVQDPEVLAKLPPYVFFSGVCIFTFLIFYSYLIPFLYGLNIEWIKAYLHGSQFIVNFVADIFPIVDRFADKKIYMHGSEQWVELHLLSMNLFLGFCAFLIMMRDWPRMFVAMGRRDVREWIGLNYRHYGDGGSTIFVLLPIPVNIIIFTLFYVLLVYETINGGHIFSGAIKKDGMGLYRFFLAVCVIISASICSHQPWAVCQNLLVFFKKSNHPAK